MIINNLLAIYINLLHFTNSQYVTIWSESMESVNPNGWSGFHNFDFGYTSTNCPHGDSNKCAVVRAKNGNSDISKTTDISLYSALQLVFDVKVHGMETDDFCAVYYEYNNEGWLLQWDSSTDGGHFNEITDFPKPAINNTAITIALEVVGDATGDGNTDKCYWDNVVLKGILYTTSPTLYPSINPSTNPSLTPTLNPSLNPSTYPSLNPTLHPSSNPTLNPSTHSTPPTMNPSTMPTTNPTVYPSFNPSLYPSTYPSTHPSLNPTLNPTTHPSINPSKSPTVDGIMVIDITTTDIIKAEHGINGESGGVIDTMLLVTIILVVVLLCIILILILILKQKRRVNKENLEKMKSVSSASDHGIMTTDIKNDMNMQHNITASTSGNIGMQKVTTYTTAGNIEIQNTNVNEMKNTDDEDSLYNEGNDAEIVTKQTPFDDKKCLNDNDLLEDDDEGNDDYDDIYTQESHQTTTGNIQLSNDND